jgi:flavin-dependent dehydrogenase
MNYDAIVIGAGPAGSAVSILLAQQQYKVLLLEKSHFPRQKLCGEFITPECLTVFDRLGVRERMIEAGARLISHWKLFAPDGRGLEVPMKWIADGHPHAFGLSRARMDTVMLARAREVGVDVREGFTVSSRLRHEGPLTIVEGSVGHSESFSARVVIDASGRQSVFQTAAAAESEAREMRASGAPRLFGCKVHLREIPELSDLGELFFFKDGYGGMSNIEEDRTNLCFLTNESVLREAKGDREKLLDLTMRSNPAGRRRLEHAVMAGDWLGTGPIVYGRKKTHGDVLTIGDASAFIDPFTGSGILLALKSGELAARVIQKAFRENRVETGLIRSWFNSEHREHFGLRFLACSLLRMLTTSPRTRNALATALIGAPWIMKLTALSTRR